MTLIKIYSLQGDVGTKNVCLLWEIQEIYKGILDVDLPNFGEIERAFRKRNNIVHRYSISNLDRITITSATNADVINLEQEIRKFLTSLEANVDSLK